MDCLGGWELKLETSGSQLYSSRFQVPDRSASKIITRRFGGTEERAVHVPHGVSPEGRGGDIVTTVDLRPVDQGVGGCGWV